MTRIWWCALVALVGCEEPGEKRFVALPRPVPTSAPVVAATREVLVTTQAVPSDQPVFALQGGREAGVLGVVLHGWCSHGMGVLQAFQWAAAESGRFIALQGDHHCGAGPMRGWSNDTVALDRRVDAALNAAFGAPARADVLLVGSSQGAERAIALARSFPNKYRWLVLLSTPAAVTPTGLSALKGVFFLVGQHELQEPSRRSWRAFRGAGLRAELRVIEHAGHADMHGQGDPLLREVLSSWGLRP